ncbi:D-Ala-D-Ala carboxypeptidase family metallohydrolase [Ochrobactrum quorumnocens]|uniref:D-Ala-D-Ala carboxypeptidase family metallohydrolase n=1 Tax=Ochrobactrum quorumnocens TaxID=271865 RepID=UPI0038552587
MKFAEPSHRTARRLLSGSVALLALVLSSCTSTGNGTSPLQMTNSADGSMIADTLQSAADQTVAAEASAEAGKSEAQKAETTTNAAKTAVAEAKPADKEQKPTTVAATEAESAQDGSIQVAALAPQTKSTSLFGMFGKKSSESPAAATPEPTPEATEAAKPEQTKEQAAAAETKPTTEETKQAESPKPAESEKPTQVTSLFGSAKNANAYASPQRPTTAGQGSIARLFNDEAASGSGTSQNKKLAVVRPGAKSKHEYNYSLPGVRPNGGFEIKHRKSIYDDSDIDANEYDDYAGVQLASAPGLARLAPNGLKVQRETVDVACLKPQLVTMLKTMERHFRKPVMVTSGYRSPSYNRKVNGARKSLHMICAAADIQIDGVSKHEIARFARNMPSRGGVGTYCHTTSVHVDVGPERDWNWSCKK